MRIEPPPPWKPPRPFPVPLQTARLTLRPWHPADAPSLWQAIEESRSTLIPWMPWAASGHRDPEDTLEWIDSALRSWNAPEPHDFFLGLHDRASGRVVGGTSFHQVLAEMAQAEIGYWVREDERGRGLCTEAVRALVTSGFRDWGLRRLVLTCAASNAASARVALKAGLTLEARHAKSRWVEGQGYDDELGFAVLADEWDVAAAAPRPGLPAARRLL